MGAPKKYFREQFRINKLTLGHDDAADFYLGSWQSGQSPLPLLFIRLVLFLGCTCIVITSLVTMGEVIGLPYWPIYMTHWGLLMITIASGLAFLVSVIAAVKGPIDSSDGLPWYVKAYWVWYCIAIPAAFFITVFYYVFLSAGDVDFAFDPILDLFIHGINSVLMVCLLITARHPVHLFQFVYPFVFTVTYLIFSVIFYYAGGTGPTGDRWIYPMLDWSNPGLTTGVVFACAFFLLILHIIVMLLTSLRNYLTRRYVLKFNNIDITE